VLEARISARYREVQKQIMKGVLFWYRDVLLLADGGDPSLVSFKAFQDVLGRRAAAIRHGDALANIARVEDMNRRLDRSITIPTVLSAGFAGMK